MAFFSINIKPKNNVMTTKRLVNMVSTEPKLLARCFCVPSLASPVTGLRGFRVSELLAANAELLDGWKVCGAPESFRFGIAGTSPDEPLDLNGIAAGLLVEGELMLEAGVTKGSTLTSLSGDVDCPELAGTEDS